ncbi:hypothetical protein ACTHGU_07660 [Chitinophagaceae bacterium MMS25-I14]
MNHTVEEIIKGIDKATGGYYPGGLSNLSDINMTIVPGFQLLFGVCYPDPMANDVEHYIHGIQSVIKLDGRPKALPWPFDDKELMINTLEQLSTYYNANLNVLRMMQGIDFLKRQVIYLVVTIIEIPIIVSQ